MGRRLACTISASSHSASAVKLSQTGENIQQAQAGPYTVTPRGFGIQQLPTPDPLDPKGINTFVPSQEMQQIANTLFNIVNRNFSGLNPHVYKNLPERTTGAQLPPSAQGYTTFDVPSRGSTRGLNRLIVDNATGATYYTNTHYQSFYPVLLLPP